MFQLMPRVLYTSLSTGTFRPSWPAFCQIGISPLARRVKKPQMLSKVVRRVSSTRVRNYSSAKVRENGPNFWGVIVTLDFVIFQAAPLRIGLIPADGIGKVRASESVYFFFLGLVDIFASWLSRVTMYVFITTGGSA
jgi:hypothetical protein